MNHLTVEEWSKAFEEFIKQHPPTMEALLSNEHAVITDTDLLKYGNIKAAILMEPGKEVLTGAKLASFRFQKGTGKTAELIFVNSTGGHNVLSDLRAEHVGLLVSVPALVKSRSEVRPRLSVAIYQCMRCGAIHHHQQMGIRKLEQPLECYKENGGCSRAASSTKFRLITTRIDTMGDKTERSEMIDEQWLEVQEPPEDLEADAKPRDKLVRLVGGRLMDEVSPGDKVILHGILDLDDEDQKKLSPRTFLDAHYIERQADSAVEATEEEIALIEEIARGEDPLTEAIIPSIAPHLVGIDEPKAACATQLFGGSNKRLGTKKVRGSIHIGLFGDPGTGKSELMRFMVEVSPRGMFTTAKGSTEVGLTAAAVQEKEFGEGRWTIRAGALVLADNGVCAIDEAGEMKDTEFKALEEAMEQQTITVTKAGMATTMNARTAVLLAGNPKGGRKWSTVDSIYGQVNIPPSTLSRIDLFFIILDDTSRDDAVRSRIKSYFGAGAPPPVPPLTPQQLRKYAMLGRRYHPRPSPEALARFDKYHAILRDQEEDNPFTIRTYEALLRVGQSLARMRFSDEITEKDALTAIAIHSAGWDFIVRGGMFDIEVIATGISRSQRERMRAILDILEENPGIDQRALEDHCQKAGVTGPDMSQALKRLLSDGRIYEPRDGEYKVI